MARLKAAAKEEDTITRQCVAVALWKIGSPETYDTLIELLADQNSFVRGFAACGLGKVGNKQAIPHLLAAQDKETSDDVLKDIENALKALRSERAQDQSLTNKIETLIDGLKDDVPLTSMRGLAQIGAPAVDPLIRAMKDKGTDYGIRSAAVVLLRLIGDRRAIQPLREVINDKDEDQMMREQAKKSLEEIERNYDDADSVDALTKHGLPRSPTANRKKYDIPEERVEFLRFLAEVQVEESPGSAKYSVARALDDLGVFTDRRRMHNNRIDGIFMKARESILDLQLMAEQPKLRSAVLNAREDIKEIVETLESTFDETERPRFGFVPKYTEDSNLRASIVLDDLKRLCATLETEPDR